MQKNTQCSASAIGTGSGEPVVIHIPSRSKQGSDFVDSLRQSRFGLFYRNHLKRIPLVRPTVIWTWRNFYPLCARLLSMTKAGKRRKLVRFSDYIKDNGRLLLDSCNIDSVMPRVFPETDQHYLIPPSAHVVFPKIRVAVVESGIQYGGTNLVLVDEQAICHDLYDFKLDATSEELHGRAQIDAKASRIRWLMFDDMPETIAEAAPFVDACAGNYAHWMTEVLPRIALFCEQEQFKEIPIVVNEGLHKNIMESLMMIAGARQILALPTGRALKIEKLYLTSVTGYVPFDRRDDKLDGHSDGIFSSEALRKLSRCLAGKAGGGKSRRWPEKIYLQRNSGTRKVANQVALEQLLARHGYTTIDPEKLTFAQQVQIFSKAESIIGPTGAAFANAIFCRPDAKVTILMGKHKSMIYRYWCNMLAPLGISVNYILGDIVDGRHLGIHGDFDVALADVADLLAEIYTGRRPVSIHPTAEVSADAQLGEGVEIGPFSIIHGNVILGDRVKVAAYCELGIATPLGDGSPLVIGDDALIRSHSVFYESSSFGKKLVTGHRVTVRENTIAGLNFQIGTLSEIQGDCTVGDYVRFQSNVFVGKKTTIGNFVWVLPYVVLTNDPTPPSDNLIGCTLEDFSSIAAASVVLPGVTIGHHALVAAKACVTKDVPPHKVVAGVPARIVGDTKDIKLRDGSEEPAYPWTRHFTRGYPEAVVAGWINEEGKK